MKITTQSSNIQQQVTGNALLRSRLASPPDFASYLKGDKVDQRFAVQVPAGMDAPEIDQMARETWGTAYDPATMTVRLDTFAKNTQAATDAFARKLGGLLRANGIDTSDAITLVVGQDGSVYATGDTPYKAAIDGYFAEHPDLGDEFRKVSEDNDMVAIGTLSAELTRRWQGAGSASRRQALTSYFSSMFDHAKQLRGQMSLSMDMLSAPALSYAKSMASS